MVNGQWRRSAFVCEEEAAVIPTPNGKSNATIRVALFKSRHGSPLTSRVQLWGKN
jgi:hypothetical protein